MKFRFSFFTIAVLLIQFTLAAQTGWQPQPVSIKTRWTSKVNPTNFLSEYPRPQLVRTKWTNLNGLWEYAISDSNSSVNKYDGKILVPYPIESSLSGVKKSLKPNQLLWYKRSINKPTLKIGERVLLHFGAIDFEARVNVNGKEVGEHKGGYQNFTFDITDALKRGPNELVVTVWDPSDKGPNPHGKQVLNPQGIMYTPSSGIWQTVWMEIVPAKYIESLTITPDVDKKQVRVKVNASSNDPVTLTADGKTVKCKANTDITFPITIIKLWSPDQPYLYDLTVTLGADKVKSYFGMRKIEIKQDEKGIDRIFLNNKYTYNLGTLDQGFWPDGLYTAPTDEALEFDIKAIKAMGFNTIRKHIKIEPERWYYHCDKLGMLVWQDMVNPGNDSEEGHQQFEKECKENIVQLYNHPSITSWVLFNEKWGQYDQARLTKWMKAEDPTRLVNGHSGEILYVNDQLRSPSPNAWVGADMTDVHAYPNPGHMVLEKGKASVIGEFGGIGVPIEGHLWDDLVVGWGYDGIVTPNKMKQQYSYMVDSLKVLEKQGLSASIYTQPFDVESEQNGLISYDREVIKLPVETIRNINGRLWPITSNYRVAIKGFNTIVADQNGNKDYATRLKDYENGKKDSSFLRSLAIMALQRNDRFNLSKAASDYLYILKNPFAEINLKFINRTTISTKDPGFKLFYNNIQKVNAILGEDASEGLTTMLIEKDYILPYTKDGLTPDWASITSKLVKDYGSLGEEIAMQSQVLYAANHKEWASLGKLIRVWFPKYGIKRKWIGAGLINGLAWSIFENINDTSILEATLSMTAHAVQMEAFPELLDTHANILYKLGKKEEALEWESKALAAAPNNGDIKAIYEKMKAGLPTWPASN